MLRAKIFVQLKAGVLDPQGKAVMNSLITMGYKDVVQTTISKYIQVDFDNSDVGEVKRMTKEMCDNLLANPNTESYRFEIEEI